MATYGDFPGVKVTTQSGGVPSVSIGAEEKLVLFGPANYTTSNSVDGSASANSPEQIKAPLEADRKFGEGSELAAAMKEAIQNGANLDFLYGVAPSEVSVTDESQGTQTGTLANYSVKEDRAEIVVDDIDGTGAAVQSDITVEFRYSSPPPTPDDTSGDVDKIHLNPETGEYAADQAPTDHFAFDYDYHDFAGAFGAKEVRNVVDEGETGVYWALTESDNVSSDLDTEVSSLRKNYVMVNGFCFAEPNDSTVLDAAETSDLNGGAEPHYDTSTYAEGSVSAAYFYKVAPARVDNDPHKTIGGGLGGLYAGSPINDAIYNEVVSGYDSLEQSFTKTDADNMRDNDVIPVRSAGSVRVKGNRSTAYGDNTVVAGDFWARRIADRVILIGKKVGDEILGNINDQQTRNAARRLIESEMQKLVADRLIKPNTQSTQNWNVSVYEEENNPSEVNIDISFTPYGIAKRIDETVTVST